MWSLGGPRRPDLGPLPGGKLEMRFLHKASRSRGGGGLHPQGTGGPANVWEGVGDGRVSAKGADKGPYLFHFRHGRGRVRQCCENL